MTMKLSEITEPGFYWNRMDEHREWTTVYVGRLAKNPMNPKFNEFAIDGYVNPLKTGMNTWPSNQGEFVGPLNTPEK